jgi:hypothetical protein
MRAGRKTVRSSKLHGRLYAVQKGDDRRERRNGGSLSPGMRRDGLPELTDCEQAIQDNKRS